MSMVTVRYHKSELEADADYDSFDADSFYVHEDNTLELRRKVGSKVDVVAIIHPSRWDAVYKTEDAEVSEG